ncbi:MAG: YcgN family cysteine cluster protein [Pseudomonadota bacterium]
MTPPDLRPGFWRDAPLSDLSREEWEALCDGCGRCCLLKLEDEDTGELAYTDVHCRLYDPAACRCGNYALRKVLVPGCVVLTPDNIHDIKDWMPVTCAYRLLAEGRDLPEWHPLVCGDPDGPRRAGVAADGRNPPGPLSPEWEVDEEDLPDHAVEGFL